MSTNLCLLVLNRQSHWAGQTLPVSYPLTALIYIYIYIYKHIYICIYIYVICAFFLQVKNTEKEKHKRKKIIKDLENRQQKTMLFCSILCIQNTHTHTHTNTHTAVSSLTAPCEIRLIRFRKIINKLINRVGETKHCMTDTHTHTHKHTLPGIICSAPKSFFTVGN